MRFLPEDRERRVIDHPTANLRVLGPPASGKTRLLLARFRALEQRQGGGVFILTYSSDSHRRLTDAVFDKNTARVGPPRVFTYSRLAEEVIESAGIRPPAIVADLEERLLLQEVIADREARLESDLRTICRSVRFRDDVLDVCHLLLQNDVAGRSLGAMKAAAGDAELSDVLILYEGFREALESRDAATYYDVAWRAAKLGRENLQNHPFARAAAILVEDFQDVDPGQFALLTALAPPGGPVALNVFGDPMGSVFARRGTQHGYLMTEFPRLYGGETFRLSARRPGGLVPAGTLEALLEETIHDDARVHLPVVIEEEPREGTPQAARHRQGMTGTAGPPAGFGIEVTRDEMDEVYVVAARIARFLRERTFAPHEVAIVTNEKQRYESLLMAAATQRGIPLDTGHFVKTVFGDFVDALLAIIDSPDDVIAARSVRTSPLSRYVQGDVSREKGGGSERSSPATDEPPAFVGDIRRAIRSAEPARWMRIIAERCLRRACEAYAVECGDVSVFGELCRLLESWDRYAAAVERWGGRPSVGGFAALDALLAKRRATNPRDAVVLLSCREAKGRFFPAVFVLGCSELLFPSAGRSANVLPMAALERALRRACPDRPLEVYRARPLGRALEEEHHLLYVALTRANTVLHVTAPQAFSGGDYPAPCAILERTVPAASYLDIEPAQKVPPQIRFARSWAAGGEGRGADPRVERLSPAGFHWHAPRPSAAMVPVAPFPLSKTSIDTYLACPRRFFYRKVLRIPEADSLPAKVGSLFHAVMAALGGRYSTKAEFLAGVTPEIIRETVDEAVRGDETTARAAFFHRSLRHHLESMVGKIVDLERGDPENYTVRAIEEPIKYPYGPWEFTGRIDRVHEVAPGHTVIVDYKTGKIAKLAKTLRSKTLATLEGAADANWQVPLYVWGVKTREGRLPDAFKHMVTSPREKPFAITLFIRDTAADVPPQAMKGNGPSYLLDSEIESAMARAAGVAGEIFTPRSRFARTEDRAECYFCDFGRLCRREDR